MQVPADEEFAKLVGNALDELPEKYVGRLDNVLITYEDEPTPEQRVKLNLQCNQSLFGLYEGIPLTQRGNNYNMVLPDKITIFKLPLFHASTNESDLRAKIKHTLWHEIAHFFGLNHSRIHELEDKRALQK